MLRLHHSVICAAALTLAACTQAPLTPKAAVSMDSATTNQDWQQISHNIAGALRQRGMLLAPMAGITPGSPPWGPYYVHVQTPDSAFLKSVADTLKADIISAGGTVASAPDGAVVINLKVDYVRHGPREQVPAGAGAAVGTVLGLGTIAGSSAARATGSWSSAGIAAGSALLGGVIADSFLMNNPTMMGEALWQASIHSKQQVLMQVGGAVYISSADIPLYTGDVKLAEMTTPGASLRLETIRLRYSGGGGPAQPMAAPPATPPCRC